MKRYFAPFCFAFLTMFALSPMVGCMVEVDDDGPIENAAEEVEEAVEDADGEGGVHVDVD